MDVNGTKFHLLLTRDDWARCTFAGNNEKLRDIWNRPADAQRKFDWNENAGAVALQKQVYKFKSSPKEEKPRLESRRGAARDRYGNWYWIDADGLKIKVLSVGSKKTSDFYPSPVESTQEKKPGAFQPLEPVAPAPEKLCGLAVTCDHFLVAGTIEPAGLLIFDLFAGGEPRRVLWRPGTAFVPFDMAARGGGGVFILDRQNKRFWTLDRDFTAVGVTETVKPEIAEGFQPVDEREERKINQRIEAEDYFTGLTDAEDPIAIEALPDDTVLILDLPAKKEEFSVIYRYHRRRLLGELKLDAISPLVEEPEIPQSPPPVPFRLRGFDLAFAPADPNANDGEEKNDRLFIAAEDGNQAFTFRMACEEDAEISVSPPLPAASAVKKIKLEPIAEYFPMRLFGGKGLAAAEAEVYYDFGERWLALKKQNRPRFELFGRIETPPFDGKEPDCVWHRLLIDACIPPETSVEVFSRSAENEEDLPLAEWVREPPLYLRGNGSELPFAGVKTDREKGRGTWELLLQRVRQRWLQLRLDFSGNGQRTPLVSALRVYYPRFSYLENYLPAVYRDDRQSAFFLDGFLSNVEGIYTGIEDRLAAAQMLFDVRSAPGEALEWLADWLGAALDPAWSENKRRLFISRAVDFFQYRGTLRGVRIALRLALDPCADESIFELQTGEQKRREPVRIVERFQTRRTPELIPSDSLADQNLPRLIEPTEKWKPAQGADVLDQQYREQFKKNHPPKFPLIRPDDPAEAAIWEQFARGALGFVPSSAASAEQRLWQEFLREEYQDNPLLLNQAHQSAYLDFDEIFLPRGSETQTVLREDWARFIDQTHGKSRSRQLWQDFLARRYRRINRLNEIYATGWSSFEYVSLFDQLPFFESPAADWLQFEGGVLPMHRTAHRFTVMIPALLNGGRVESLAEQNRKLELVKRVVELEKPAHTVVDFRFYWNLFRLDEVRLGYDTLLGLGSRDPLLNPSLILGESFIGESRLAPEKRAERYVLGNEILEKN